MKVEIRKESQEIWLALSMQCHYTSDYQMRMIERTGPAGILPVRFAEKDGETTFLYRITDMYSLQQYYRHNALNDKEMFLISEAVLSVIDEMRHYLLDPEHLVLNPACIYRHGEELLFCYLPIYRKPFRESFHVLTEYFVKELDYENADAIQAACRFHKYTMEENYDLERIIRQVRKEVSEKSRQRNDSGENNIDNEADFKEQDHTFNPMENVQEERMNSLDDAISSNKKVGKTGRFRRRKKKMSKWGEWENL